MNSIDHIIDLMEQEGVRKVEYYLAGYYSVTFADGSNTVIRREITEAAE